VLGQLTRQEQTNGSLDLATGDGGSPVVVSQTRGLGSDSLENVVDKRVHDAHGLAADASVGVNLLQHLVDVDRVALPPPPVSFLGTATCGFGLGGGLLSSLRRWFWTHACRRNVLPQASRKLLYQATVLQTVSSKVRQGPGSLALRGDSLPAPAYLC